MLPLAGSGIEESKPMTTKLYGFQKPEKRDKILLITKDFETYCGNVIGVKEVNRDEHKITKGLNNKINNKLSLKVGDNLSIITNRYSYNGYYKGLKNRCIIVSNNFKDSELVEWKKIREIYINNISVPENTIKSIKVKKKCFDYEVKIKSDTDTLIFHSDDIHEIKIFNQPTSILVYFIGGLLIDLMLYALAMQSIPYPS